MSGPFCFLACQHGCKHRGDSRAEIVAAIKQGTTFVTAFKGTDGKWQRGQKVFIVVIRGVEYLKTVDNGRAVDKLDNLPEF